MYFRLSVKSIISRLFTLLALSAAIGFLFDQTILFLFVSCFAILCWHYHHLLKLVKWLWRSKSISPPQSEGVWGRIYDGLYRQVRQHRQKQKQLNDKLRKFRDGAEALPDAALVLSEELTILWGNKKAQRMLGIRWPGDIGQRIDNLIRFPEFSKYLELGNFEQPCQISSPVNHDIQLELRLMAYGSDQVLFLARDISKIYRLEEMRRDFVANVSHELKTPLTVVRGYTEMILASQGDFDPHWQKAFGTIETQVSRMDRLVEQLLVLSRIEIANDRDEKHSIDMSTLINGLVDDATWLNQDKQHKISAEIDDEIFIEGIDTELKSACLNLISNAIAYTSPKGVIDISWQLAGNKAKFSVRDNGPGIQPEHVNRITERFFRVDQSRSRDTGGSGLGLSIVKHVLQHHNAELVIESTWGKGSEFIIYFEYKT
jgi:two-component system phosphate regulon sensor histidine kinase PhoR